MLAQRERDGRIDTDRNTYIDGGDRFKTAGDRSTSYSIRSK